MIDCVAAAVLAMLAVALYVAAREARG